MIPIWFLLVTGSKNFTFRETFFGLILLCSVTAAIFLPWQLYIYAAYPLEAQWEGQYNISHLTEVIEGHTRPFYYHFDSLRILFGELVYIPLIWITWKSIKKWKNHRRMLLCIWVFIPLIFFSLTKTKMQGYILFTAPAIFIITALFWQYLFHYRNMMRFKWLIYMVLFLLLALPVRYSIERIKPFEYRERRPEWVQEIRDLETIGGRSVLFNYGRPIEAMFYSDCIVYTSIPDLRTIEKILAAGYEVILNDDGNLPHHLKTSDEVKVIRLSSPEE